MTPYHDYFNMVRVYSFCGAGFFVEKNKRSFQMVFGDNFLRYMGVVDEETGVIVIEGLRNIWRNKYNGAIAAQL